MGRLREKPETPTAPPVLGLDLGQRKDYTALAVVQRICQLDPLYPENEKRWQYRHVIRKLKRWPLGTPYPVVIDELRDIIKTDRRLKDCLLAVDATGVGTAVVDFIRQAQIPASLNPILITSGHATTRENNWWHVAKVSLVSVLQVLLQTRRLQCDPMPEREVLVRELQSFRVRITASMNEQYTSWREAAHDDAVLAVACACWLGERFTPGVGIIRFQNQRHSIADRMRGESSNWRGLYGLTR